MRGFFTRFVAVTVLAAVTFGAVAETVTIGDFVYDISYGQASVTGLSSTGLAKYKNGSTVADMTVPSTITSGGTTYKVFSIARAAFKGCTKIGTVTLQYNMQRINDSAFDGCSNMTTLYMPGTMNGFYGCPFTGCGKLSRIYCSALTPPALANDMVFYGIHSNAELYVARYDATDVDYRQIDGYKNSFKAIKQALLAHDYRSGNDCFLIIKPSNGTDYGELALVGTIPTSGGFSVNLKYSYTNVFGGKYYVTEIVDNCYEDTEIVSYDDSNARIAEMYYNAFVNCPKLTTLTLGADKIYSPVDNCPALTTLNIYSKKVLSFHGCSSLKTLNVYGSTTIDDFAFRDCTSLETIDLGSWTQSIGKQAFLGSIATSLTIPSSLTTIDTQAFLGMNSLRSISVYGDNPNYSSLYGILYNKDLTTLLYCPPALTQYGSKDFTREQFSPETTTIGNYAFYKSIAHSIVVPLKVTEVKDDAFAEMASLASLEFGPRVNKFGLRVFSNDNNLKNIKLPVQQLPAHSKYTSGYGTILYRTFDDFDRQSCTLSVYDNMVSDFQQDSEWKWFKITGMGDPEPMGELWIAGVKVTNANCGKGAIVSGVSVSLDAVNNMATVTMDKVNYTTSKTFFKTSLNALNINVVGNNTVTADNFITVNGENSVSIAGDNTGTLTATGTSSTTPNIDLSNGGLTCLIAKMKELNIISSSAQCSFLGTADKTLLWLFNSAGEFRSNSKTATVKDIKGLTLNQAELTNCYYDKELTQYGNRGSMKFGIATDSGGGGQTTGNKYDVNGDKSVDVGDVNTVLGDILATSGTTLKYDVNGDSRIDVGDVNAILAYILSPSGGTGGDVETYKVGNIEFKMIKVKGGTFTMGATSEQGSDAKDNEKPTHRVTLSDYYIGEIEVTEGLWKAVMGENPSKQARGNSYPVEYVTWDDCQMFVKKLSEMTGEKFRLPTEAEWEFAARGGTKSKGYKYAGGNNASDVAWTSWNSDNWKHATNKKTPNELGLYDMSGNVWEWCQDVKGDYSSGAVTNPQGPATVVDRSYHVTRGGAWDYSDADCRVSRRIYAASFYNDTGMRLAK